MKFLILLVTVSASIAFDYLGERNKYIDHDIDPCDNFYRHSCRMDSPKYLPVHFASLIAEKNRKEAKKLYPEFQDFQNDIEEESKMTRESIPKIFQNIFNIICNSNQSTLQFLTEVERMQSGETDCEHDFCLTHLAKDPNCENVEKHLQLVLNNPDKNYMTPKRILVNYQLALEDLSTVDSYWTNEELSQEGELQDYFQEMKTVAAELIMETPWANNHNVSEMILSVLDRLSLSNSMESIRALPLGFLKQSNAIYSECKKSYANVKSDLINSYCFVFTHSQVKPNKQLMKLNLDDALKKAFIMGSTIYPKIFIGYIWYQMFLNTRSQATRLGAPGFIIAHELSHALVKSTEHDILTYFSDEARKCIQEQYRSSCKYFDEGGCVIGEEQFEENGADVFAVEIVLRLFNTHFMKDDKELKDTQSTEELKELFYAMASNLCSGGKQLYDREDPHSASNIRINALVNHPAFQKAFQCSDDSRMMQSKTKQCSVYGQHAPVNRRHFHPRKL